MKAAWLSLVLSPLVALSVASCALDRGVLELEDAGSFSGDTASEEDADGSFGCSLSCWEGQSGTGCCGDEAPRCAPNSTTGAVCSPQGELTLDEPCGESLVENCRSTALCVEVEEAANYYCQRRCLLGNNGNAGCEPRRWNCAEQADCPTGYICQDGGGCQPRRFCSNNSVCPVGQTCDSESSLCQSVRTCVGLGLQGEPDLGVCLP